MKVLITGGGGREHALAWKCAQSPLVNEVLVAPGNAGTGVEPCVRNVGVAAEDIDALLRLATDEDVALTIVGPEAPLVAGIADRFAAAGLACFGPGRDAARLEGSKDFAKRFMQRHGIPTAAFRTFTDADEAREYVRERGGPLVVKADGLAAGKGVTVAADTSEALGAIDAMLAERRLGRAGDTVVVEECLAGEEASYIVITDGTEVLPLATSQDHKARDDGDRGPNTGGMGAYSPAALIDGDLEERILSEIIRPTIAGLAAEGIAYRGFLYAGLMISPERDVKVLEYNCRFGDPETQPILARLDADLVELCVRTIEGRLGECSVSWDPRAALGVVMASGGYPGRYEKGHRIEGLGEVADDCLVFHAGTALEGDRVLTAGGRVLCVVGLGETVGLAQKRAYAGVERISWTGEFHRHDIGYRAVQSE